MAEARNAWIAGILNFFFWGVGYLYCEKKKVSGVLIFLGYVVLLSVNFFINEELISTPLLIAGYSGDILISIGLAYDAFREAKK